MKLPEVGKTYNYYDDGKIRESRRSDIEIIKITPFSEVDEATLELWEKEVEECPRLYAESTDFFITGFIEALDKEVVFVRTLDDRWFSLGWWAGVLDVDGTLFEKQKKMEEGLDD